MFQNLGGFVPMNRFSRILLAQAFVCAGLAQETLEVGAIGGFGFSNSYKLTNSTGTANASLSNGGALGAYFGGDSGDRWGGEVRYLYRFTDPKLTGPGGSANFNGHTHLITGNILAYFKPRASKFRPFLSFGGGVKRVAATGLESSSQPLGRFAGLTNTNELLAVADIGAGVKYSLGKSVKLRLEVHDYLGKRPEKVITAAPGATASGFVNDIVASVSIGYSW
jgi:hypothetical protein